MITNIDTRLVDQILNLPEAPVIIDKLNKAWEQEQQKRIEFYNEISEVYKSEFINGEIIIHSPVVKIHNDVSGNLYKIMDAFVVDRELGYVGIEKILIKLLRNDYEPDVCYFKKNKAVQFKEDQKFFPPPDLIVEVISKSTEKRDRGIKYHDYEKNGVEEYWLVDPSKKTVEQYYLKDEKYKLILKSNSGRIKCFSIKDLTIPIETIFDKKSTNAFVKKI